MLKTIGLSKRFGALVAANNVSMEVGAGEVVGIIGTNGAGKTTFVNMITGYLRPSSGHIWLGGEEVTGLRPMDIARRGVGRSFQVSQLFQGLSAFENLLVAAGVGSRSVLSLLRDPERIAACSQIFKELVCLRIRTRRLQLCRKVRESCWILRWHLPRRRNFWCWTSLPVA